MPKDTIRYGIGEWFGKSFVKMTSTERKEYSKKAQDHAKAYKTHSMPCRVKGGICTKKGGVCCLRGYSRDSNGNVKALDWLVTLCPKRFEENNMIFDWIGETILGTANPLRVKEINFLVQDITDDTEDTAESTSENAAEKYVGRIDDILIHPDLNSFRWCALETQAVYFSGASMGDDYKDIQSQTDDTLLFPQKPRRPDFRSSAPKRLMPQLMVKVPTLSRWGKKMAVVIDKPFFDAMGEMKPVDDLSNADIAWFVVDYDDSGTQPLLKKANLEGRPNPLFTTLGRAVDGLTAAKPVSSAVFENIIQDKLETQRKDKEKAKKRADKEKAQGTSLIK